MTTRAICSSLTCFFLAISAFSVLVGCSEPHDDPAGDPDGTQSLPDGSTANAIDVDGTHGREDLSWDPRKLGPFNVGFRTFKHTYSAKKGAIPTRELTVNLWYPTEAKDGELPQYFNAWNADFFYAFEGEKVIKEAKPAPPTDGKNYPVLAISHGANGFGASTATLSHYFASHGWVVAAPDHVTDTLADVGKKSPIWLRLARPLDVSAAIDALDDLPPGTLAGEPNTKRVAFGGHSRGGVTTWAASGAKFDTVQIDTECKKSTGVDCKAVVEGYAAGAHDERVACGIPMAGAGGFSPWFGETGHSKAKVPQLQLSGSADKDDPQKVWDVAGDVPLIWVDIKDACHQAFAMGACPKLKNTEGFPIIDTYSLAFARFHVLGDETPTTLGILNGGIEVSSRVTLKRKNVQDR